MSRQGTSKAMKTQVKALFEGGHSIRKISESLKISRNTVRGILRDRTQKPKPEGHWSQSLPVDEICEKRRKGRPLKTLHEFYAPQVPYVTFARFFKKALGEKVAVATRLQHKPGEKAYVDYADGIFIYDRKTGEKTKTQFFCGVLPFSSLTFGEFTHSQKLESFINSHERMWEYFGGVTPYLVVDNLKSGVTKAHIYDPDVNPTYCDYANKRGFAVLPARPGTPRDKASVEAAIGVVQRSFFQDVSEIKFYSLGELNQAFREFLDRLNLRIMKDYGVSRRDRFEEEKPQLLPMPTEAYEISTWKESKVHPDCHIQVLRNFYSAPHSFVGKIVRVRIREKLIEIFDHEGQKLACHTRKQGAYSTSTYEEHLPQKSQQLSTFDIQSGLGRAKAVGENTHKLVAKLFADERPLRNLRLVQGILRLAHYQFSKDAMEYASSQALLFGKPRLAFIKACAQHFPSKPKPLGAPKREASTLHLHFLGDHP